MILKPIYSMNLMALWQNVGCIMSSSKDSWLIVRKQIGTLYHEIYGIGDKMNVIPMEGMDVLISCTKPNAYKILPVNSSSQSLG